MIKPYILPLAIEVKERIGRNRTLITKIAEWIGVVLLIIIVSMGIGTELARDGIIYGIVGGMMTASILLLFVIFVLPEIRSS